MFLIQRSAHGCTDVVHVEVQVRRSGDFEDRMVSYWSGLALKYPPETHRIQQVVLWPLGGGTSGMYQRDRLQLGTGR